MTIPGAIILGVEYQALGLLRQLHATGVPCILADQDRWGVARFSRYCGITYQCPPYDSDQFWSWLVKLHEQERLDGWLLISTDDEQVRQIALHIEDATQRFRYVGPSWSLYEKIYDKRLNYRGVLNMGFFHRSATYLRLVKISQMENLSIHLSSNRPSNVTSSNIRRPRRW